MDKLANYDLMMQRVQQLESQIENNNGAAQILNGMIERGEVVQNMNGEVVVDPPSNASIN